MTFPRFCTLLFVACSNATFDLMQREPTQSAYHYVHDSPMRKFVSYSTIEPKTVLVLPHEANYSRSTSFGLFATYHHDSATVASFVGTL